MPELPEVETIRRDLEGRVVGRKIMRVTIAPDTGKPVPVIKGTDESTFREGVAGATISGVSRRGKYLVFELDHGHPSSKKKNGSTPHHTALIVVHLRMTGAMLHRRADAPPDRYLRATLSLDDGTELRFTDLRKFGGLWLVDDISQAMATQLGPEPLSDDFTLEAMTSSVAKRKAPVKSVLLDQRRIAGIGNIYADEACFEARIDPRRLGETLRKPEIKKLHAAVRSVLAFGVESRGASFRDYQDADGKQGSMQMRVKVFRRTGKPCYVCKTPVQRVKLGGRSTHFCPKCQR